MAHSERVYPVGLFRVALVVITSALFTGKLIFHFYQCCSSDLLTLLKISVYRNELYEPMGFIFEFTAPGKGFEFSKEKSL